MVKVRLYFQDYLDVKSLGERVGVHSLRVSKGVLDKTLEFLKENQDEFLEREISPEELNEINLNEHGAIGIIPGQIHFPFFAFRRVEAEKDGKWEIHSSFTLFHE